MHEVGEPQAGRALRVAVIDRGEDGKLAVGGGQHGDVAGRLPEIDRLAAVVDAAGLSLKEMHEPPFPA